MNFKRTAVLLAALLALAALLLTSCAKVGEIRDQINGLLSEAGKVEESEKTGSELSEPTSGTTAVEPTPSDYDPTARTSKEDPSSHEEVLPENGSYTTKEDLVNYIRTYGKLPSNFITKKEAQALGWSGGSLEKYAPGKCIGGDYFGNYEELLPVKEGRIYTECDVDTLGASSRGAKRIVFSNDGLIFYTDDHYESFTKLYGD